MEKCYGASPASISYGKYGAKITFEKCLIGKKILKFIASQYQIQELELKNVIFPEGEVSITLSSSITTFCCQTEEPCSIFLHSSNLKHLKIHCVHLQNLRILPSVVEQLETIDLLAGPRALSEFCSLFISPVLLPNLKSFYIYSLVLSLSNGESLGEELKLDAPHLRNLSIVSDTKKQSQQMLFDEERFTYPLRLVLVQPLHNVETLHISSKLLDEIITSETASSSFSLKTTNPRSPSLKKLSICGSVELVYDNILDWIKKQEDFPHLREVSLECIVSWRINLSKKWNPLSCQNMPVLKKIICSVPWLFLSDIAHVHEVQMKLVDSGPQLLSEFRDATIFQVHTPFPPRDGVNHESLQFIAQQKGEENKKSNTDKNETKLVISSTTPSTTTTTPSTTTTTTTIPFATITTTTASIPSTTTTTDSIPSTPSISSRALSTHSSSYTSPYITTSASNNNHSSHALPHCTTSSSTTSSSTTSSSTTSSSISSSSTTFQTSTLPWKKLKALTLPIYYFHMPDYPFCLDNILKILPTLSQLQSLHLTRFPILATRDVEMYQQKSQTLTIIESNHEIMNRISKLPELEHLHLQGIDRRDLFGGFRNLQELVLFEPPSLYTESRVMSIGELEELRSLRIEFYMSPTKRGSLHCHNMPNLQKLEVKFYLPCHINETILEVLLGDNLPQLNSVSLPTKGVVSTSQKSQKQKRLLRQYFK